MSMFKTAVMLSRREGAFILDEAKQRRLGFAIEGFHFRQLFSMCRYVDDATPATSARPSAWSSAGTLGPALGPSAA